MSPETISSEKLNRLYLIKHHLLQKAKKNNLVKVVGDICGLHAQASSTPSLSLWNRVENFENAQLDKALYNDKTVVKTWCMRGTLHVIPSVDLPVYNRALRRMWFEHHGRYMRTPEWPSREQRQRVIYPRILQALAGEPLKRKQLNDKVRSLLKNDALPYDRIFSGWGGILKETAYEGLTVHAQPCGVESCFARLDKWLPHVNLNRVSEEEAQKELLLRYLKGYGPATQQDFGLWSGLMAADAKNAIENASSLLKEAKIEGANGRFYMLKEDFKTLDSINLKEKVPLSLLPKFDSILLGHKDRTRIIRDEYKKQVFRPIVGDIAATVLTNGQVVGTWKLKKTQRTLTIIIEPFEKISREDLKEVEERAKALSQFLGFKELRLSIAS